jgi:hypothetical protein
MPITIEYVVIVVASRSRLVGLFKNQHANALILHRKAIARDRPPKRDLHPHGRAASITHATFKSKPLKVA